MPRPWNKIQSLWDSSFFDIELKLTILMPPNSKKKKNASVHYYKFSSFIITEPKLYWTSNEIPVLISEPRLKGAFPKAWRWN
jgi:hypothetical protein